MSSLIVFSHLRWDFVYQRPQHLLSRLAAHFPVVFIEEPVYDAGSSLIKVNRPAPNVQVWRPHTEIAAPGFHDDQLPHLRKMLQQQIIGEELRDYIVWLYTPMALPLLNDLAPRAIVYDCMDELSAFKNAPRQLLQRENALLKIANLVFTGGPSLYRAKRERHSAVHCFPSSVDAEHFGRARGALDPHPLLAGIRHPRLGFFGVIDERLDLDLIFIIASVRPHWRLIFVGPVVKIDASRLPQLPNIHYVGQQPYSELPALLAGWDVCLLPFALNDATRYISPTKTLEYMVAEKPIVSTSITDVVELYSDVVGVADGAEAFIAACERALEETEEQRSARAEKMRNRVAGTSWDRTASSMFALLKAACANGVSGSARDMLDLPATTLAPRKRATYDCIVVGAGPTGLSAAYHVGEKSLLLEKGRTVGGWCRSIVDSGFTFDYAGHIMFSHEPYVHQLYGLLLGTNVHWQDREAWIYSKGVYTRYPFQGALYGLPPKVLKECIIGAIEARFGSLRAKPTLLAAASERNETVRDCCADGIAENTVPWATARDGSPRNFEEFIYLVWGAGVAKHFAIPYNRKLWTVPLTEMETSWLGGRVPLPDLEQMIEGALEPVAKPMGPNARFGYPLRGGFQALMNGFLPLLKGELKLNAEVSYVSPLRRSVTLADGTTYGYEKLISTIPLPLLIKAIAHEAPQDVRHAAERLRHVSVRCVNIGVGREDITEKHWIYYPEDSVFHRIFVQGNASPYCNPPGGFGLTCEITYSPYKPLPCQGHKLIQRCISDCVKVGIIREYDPILTANQCDLPYAYVVYDHARAALVSRIRTWLAQYGIVLAGRYSEWEYYNSDHAFIAGKRAAETVMAAGEVVGERTG